MPPYYTHLKPFRPLFAEGQPILMYHKLGPRPSGVRLKGLYISARLFGSQMRELRMAGFGSALPGEHAKGGQKVCITFDDGYVSVLRYGLPELLANGFRAIQYLVPGEIGGYNRWDVAEGEVAAPLMDKGQIRDWLDAGQVIGSHTLSHVWLTRVPLEQAREEVQASKKSLEDTFGVAIEHFCYPYGDWNPRIRDLVREAGYRTACTITPGINDANTDQWSLRRLLARYQSRSPRAVWRRITG